MLRCFALGRAQLSRPCACMLSGSTSATRALPARAPGACTPLINSVCMHPCIASAQRLICTPCSFRRDFLLANYAEIKKANPGFPVLVREATGAEAKLIARYGERVGLVAGQ